MLWVQSCATYCIYYHYHKTPSQFLTLDDPNNEIEILGLPLLKNENLPTFILPSSPPHFLNVVMKTMSNLNHYKWIFGSSFCDIEQSLVNSMEQFKPILPIGPLISPSMLQEGDVEESHEKNDVCINWLDKQGINILYYFIEVYVYKKFVPFCFLFLSLNLIIIYIRF